MKLNLKSDRKWILMTWDSVLKYLGNNYEIHLVVLNSNTKFQSVNSRWYCLKSMIESDVLHKFAEACNLTFSVQNQNCLYYDKSSNSI